MMMTEARLVIRRTFVVGCAVAAVLLSGVVAANAWLARERDGSSTSGPVIALPEWDVIPAGGVQGSLRMDEGCLLLKRSVVLWPHGSTWDEEHETVQVGDQRFAVGDLVTGRGWPVGVG
jgi:hypothetical protein